MADVTIKKEEASARESQGYSCLPTTKHSVVCLSQERITAGCCLCCENCSGAKTSKRLALTSCGQPRQLRETLRVYLIRTQVEEAATEDEQASLTQRLTMIGNAFDALIQYTQSLKVSCLAVGRVLDVSHALLALHPASIASRTDEDVLSGRRQIQVEVEKRMTGLRRLIEHCSANVILPEDTCALLDNHADKRKDFLVASTNFESLLEKPRLSASQMEKLHRQHDAILEDLRQSRRLLGAELARIVRLRLQSLQRAFQQLAELREDADDDVRIVSLLKLIAMSLCQVASDAGETAFHGRKPCKELCEKCQANGGNKK